MKTASNFTLTRIEYMEAYRQIEEWKIISFGVAQNGEEIQLRKRRSITIKVYAFLVKLDRYHNFRFTDSWSECLNNNGFRRKFVHCYGSENLLGGIRIF